MALVPYKVVALAESDAQGTDGKNIVSDANISLYDELNNPATLYDDSNYTNGATFKTTDSNGVVVFYVEEGEYEEQVNSSPRRKVLAGSKNNNVVSYATTAELQATRPVKTGQRAENRERANAQYVLAPAGHVAQAGDITAVNGRVWQQQVDTQNDAVNFSNELRALNTASEISQAVEDSGKINNIRKSLLDSPLCRLFCPNKLVDTLAGALTWARSTTATYVDRYGVVRTAAIDEPREESEGWLIEGASTNLLTYSEQFDNAAWIKTNASVSTDVTAAPDGTLSADKFVESSTPGGTTHFMFNSFAPVAGQEYTISCYAKAAERTFCVVKFGNSTAFPDNVDTYFNLADGTFTDNSPSIVTPKMKKLGNGWYRCSVTATAQSNASTGGILTVALDGDRRYAGDGTSGLYIWGAQIEQLPFASSYIPTTTAPATRAKDLVEIDGLNNFPSTSKSLAVSGFFKQAGYANFNCLFATQSPVFRAFIFEDNMYTKVGVNSSAFNQPSNILSDGTYYVSTLSNNALNQYIDGAPSAQNPFSVTGTSDGAPAKIYFGRNEAGSQPAYGHIQDFRIYDFALNADEAQFLAGVK